jgi:Holliday junction resolvasome RuvABC endonuclease subunit
VTGPCVVGIDPGLRATGWAVLGLAAKPELRAAGVVTTKARAKKRGVYQADDDARTLEVLAEALEAVLRRWRPVAVAVEVPAGGKGSRAVRAMAMAHTVAVLVTRAKLGTLPLSVQIAEGKRAATGSASASKADVAAGVARALGAEAVEAHTADVPPKKREHACDAMAVALAALDSDVVRLARRLAAGSAEIPCVMEDR